MKKIFISLLILTTTLVHAEEQKWRGPDFLIIGTAKGGTSSLYEYLTEHPQIKAAVKKELNFFTKHFYKGINWYQSQFPAESFNKQFLTGEGSISYLVSPEAPKRVYHLFPKVKIIILLRNPIDRAFSHYKYYKNLGLETRNFEQLIENQMNWLKGKAAPRIPPTEHPCYCLLHSLYINHIERWVNIFPKEQVLILKSEDLLQDTERVVNQVLLFLDLTPYKLEKYPRYNTTDNSSLTLESSLKKILAKFFKPYNQELQDFLTDELELDIQLNWD